VALDVWSSAIGPPLNTGCHSIPHLPYFLYLHSFIFAFIKLLTRCGSLRKLLRFRCVITRRLNVSLYSLFVYYKSFSYRLFTRPRPFHPGPFLPLFCFIILVWVLVQASVFLLGEKFSNRLQSTCNTFLSSFLFLVVVAVVHYIVIATLLKYI